MAFTNSEGIRLWDKAKEIEQLLLPQKRQLAYEYILKLDPSIKYKNFGGLLKGLKHNKLPAEIAKVFQKSVDDIEALKNQVEYYRAESDRLIQERSLTLKSIQFHKETIQNSQTVVFTL